MAKTAVNATKTEPEFKPPSPQELEVEHVMRATGRSRVQVLNAMKVRGPEREAVIRALNSVR